MSTLGNLGAIAGGIGHGMNMRQQLNQRKLEEDQARMDMDMRRQEHEARQDDRAIANKSREASANYFSSFGAQKFMQPGTTTAPADPNAPDEPTMGVARASQTPRSEIAKIGMAESPDYDAAALKDAETLNQFKMQAYQLQGPDRAAAIAALNEKKAELIGSYIGKYAGDPSANGGYDFAKNAGRIGAHFGEVPTGAQAMQLAAVMKKHQQEGAQQALKLANAGDKAGALKVWNENGTHRFADLELVPAESSLKTPSFKMVGITTDGKRVPLAEGMTAFDAMISLESGIETAKLAMQRANNDADNKRADKTLDIEREKLGILRQKAADGGTGGKQKDDSLSDSDMQRLFPGSPTNKFVGGKLTQEPGIDRTEYNRFATWAANNDMPVSVNSHSKWIASKKPAGASRPQGNAKPFNVNEFMRK